MCRRGIMPEQHNERESEIDNIDNMIGDTLHLFVHECSV